MFKLEFECPYCKTKYSIPATWEKLQKPFFQDCTNNEYGKCGRYFAVSTEIDVKCFSHKIGK